MTSIIAPARIPVESHAPAHARRPFLPVRHYKRSRGSHDDFLAEDVRREFRYCGRSTVVSVLRSAGLGRWALEFGRYWSDRLLRRDTRSGFGLELTFCELVRGPVMLGRLSHFGFGVFVPLGGAATS